MAHSLVARLLAWVILPLVGAVAVDGWISHRTASATATLVQDRLLLGSARIVAEQLRFEDGSLSDQIPPAALELFETTDGDRIYYRVSKSEGQLVSGYDELALPKDLPAPEVPLFFETQVRNSTVRAVAYLQPVVTDKGSQDVLVEIAQTLNGRSALARSIWYHAVIQQLIIVALGGVLILMGLRNGLQPLLRLRDAVLKREPDASEPLPLGSVPSELAPLVVAFNGYAERLDRFSMAQRTFIQNAAHQLRTPLTILNTQVSYAIRDVATQQESLIAIRKTVSDAVRLVNQLLTLSAAEAHPGTPVQQGVVAVNPIVRSVLERMSAQAQFKRIDLGFETSVDSPSIMGDAIGVREVATNLIDNAIRYTQHGGTVTTRIEAIDQRIQLTVEDNGPGIPPDQRQRVFERFCRLQDRDSSGGGLGLPIVQEFAQRMGAEVTLAAPAHGPGAFGQRAVRARRRRGPGQRKPPATVIRSPVTHRAASDARNTATWAMSSGCPMRPSGVPAIICFSKSLPITPAACVPSVSTPPGAIALTRILRPANSIAWLRVIWSSAPLVAP